MSKIWLFSISESKSRIFLAVADFAPVMDFGSTLITCPVVVVVESFDDGSLLCLSGEVCAGGKDDDDDEEDGRLEREREESSICAGL